ncbi:MAG: alpha/beta hydrolase [Fimbriimonas sp.]
MTGTFKARSGEAIAYDLYLPRGSASGPAVLMCQGLSGVKSLVLPEIGRRFADAGFIALAFDYRGYGESEGAKGWVDPFSRLDDAHMALNFLAAHPQVAGLPFVYGLSLGGGIAYALAAERRDVGGVMVCSGFASGERLMRGLRRADEFVAFKERLRQNRGTTDAMVALGDLFPFSASFKSAYDALPTKSSSSIPPDTSLFHLSSGDRLLAFDYLSRLRQIAPAPLLIQHGSDDNVIPVEDAIDCYRSCGEPKRMLIHEGYDHVGLDSGPGLDLQVGYAIQFLRDTTG